MSHSIRDILDREQIAALTAKSDWRGAWAVLRVYLALAVIFALLAMFPNPLTFLIAVLLLGGQQLAFAILAHEAAHRSLFKTRWLNDRLADWLCARLIWTDVARYRQHHIAHHSHTYTERDPDMSLVAPFPCSRASLRRKFVRDLLGQTGLRRVIGLVGMDLGLLKYTVAADVERVPQDGRNWRDYLSDGLRNMGPVLLVNAALAAGTGSLWRTVDIQCLAAGLSDQFQPVHAYSLHCRARLYRGWRGYVQEYPHHLCGPAGAADGGADERELPPRAPCYGLGALLPSAAVAPTLAGQGLGRAGQWLPGGIGLGEREGGLIRLSTFLSASFFQSSRLWTSPSRISTATGCSAWP